MERRVQVTEAVCSVPGWRCAQRAGGAQEAAAGGLAASEVMPLWLHLRVHRAAGGGRETRSGRRGTSSPVPHDCTPMTVPASPLISGCALAWLGLVPPVHGAGVELLVPAAASGILQPLFWQ